MGTRYLSIRSSVRVLTAFTIVSAVAGQLQYLVENNLLNTANFLSYFTIKAASSLRTTVGIGVVGCFSCRARQR